MRKRYKTVLIISVLLSLAIADLATSDENPLSGLLHAKGMAAISLAIVMAISSPILGSALKRDTKTHSSPVYDVQGKYVIGFLVMVVIAVVTSGLIALILGLDWRWFALMVAFLSAFGVTMLVVGARRVR